MLCGLSLPLLVLLQIADIPAAASAMFKAMDMHASEFLPYSTAFREAERLQSSVVESAA